MRSKLKNAIIIVLLVVVVAGISALLFVLVFRTGNDSFPYQPHVSTVVFVNDASIIPEGPNNGIEPKVISIMIGVNNTVRWVNKDTIPHGIPTPDDEGQTDPYFFQTVQNVKEKQAFIMPGQFYEYTFTVPGRIEYHMVPHPQMKGAVIVLSAPTT